MNQTEMTSREIVGTALQWLNMFDERHFDECWADASPELKKQVNEQDFVAIMSDKRVDKAAVAARELKDEGTEMTYHRRPEIVHKVLRFEVRLITGTQYKELVTLVKGHDTSWRVANYTIL